MFGAVERERGDIVGVGRVPHEAPGSVAVQANHEEEGEMMCVPKCLETLVADLVVSSRVHEDHDQEHEVACDTTSLGIVDIQRRFWTNLCSPILQ